MNPLPSKHPLLLFRIKALKRRLWAAGAAAALGLHFQGCAVVQPLIRDINLVPLAEEKAAGEKMEAEIARQMKISSDLTQQARVRKIGQSLVRVLPKREFEYRFSVVEDPSPNAFTIPGGAIYVHTGLLSFASSDDELAGVLGHEIGHAYERHPAKAMTRALGADYLSRMLLKGQDSLAAKAALQFARGGILSKYGRDDEREADDIGFYLIQTAGYAPDGLLRFMRKLMMLSRDTTPVIFRSHPPSEERVKRLEDLLAGRDRPAGALSRRS